MNMSAYQAASQSYAALDLETSINSASPHKLILMLYDGAIASLYRARLLMQEKKIQEKGAEISRAISIIDEGLAACLNEDQGGEIAKNLAGLYGYMSNRLFQANLQNKQEWVEEVVKLLGDLREAWEQIGHTALPEGSIIEEGITEADIASGVSAAALNAGAETSSAVSYGKV